MDSWPKGIAAITLFVEDLEATRQFYRDVFGLPVFFENDDSAVFQFGETLINLLKVGNAPELIGPAGVASREAGARLVFTLQVNDVEAMCDELATHGVLLLEWADGSAVGSTNGELRRPRRLHLGDRSLAGANRRHFEDSWAHQTWRAS